MVNNYISYKEIKMSYLSNRRYVIVASVDITQSMKDVSVHTTSEILRGDWDNFNCILEYDNSGGDPSEFDGYTKYTNSALKTIINDESNEFSEPLITTEDGVDTLTTEDGTDIII